MKALSLWQPWASLIALGLKRIETRSWGTPYRGLIAIHAAKRWTREEREFLEDLAEDFPGRIPAELAKPPLGAVVCVACLADCRRMDSRWCAGLTDLERAVGAHLPGRYAWVLEDVRPLATPYPLRGYQALWDLAQGEVEAITMPVGATSVPPAPSVPESAGPLFGGAP